MSHCLIPKLNTVRRMHSRMLFHRCHMKNLFNTAVLAAHFFFMGLLAGDAPAEGVRCGAFASAAAMPRLRYAR